MTSDLASCRDRLPVLSRGIRIFVVAGLVGLSLAGCGRKAGLDAPPGASLTDSADAAPATDNSAKAASQNLLTSPNATQAPTASRGENKHIFLDGLLN